ncbi:MAG: VWA domain-containing protein [Acidobacteria bacterium]|nr:VWA domain-containing protein [Acidobacteriota bacterium]MBV9623232.1 VWA domain-containing protein [Acidobacteriota bacterium]
MRSLLLFLLFIVPVSTAQVSGSVPKPPWASTAKPAEPSAAPAAAQDDNTIRVDVKLVNVFVTITDEHGRPVSTLGKENFQVFEDGQTQKISVFAKESELPLSIVVEIDTSLSTRKDLPLELNSARRFAHSILRPVDALAVYGFNEVVDQAVPFTADLRTIDHGIDHLPMGAATALYDAVYLGSQALESRQGRKVMVIITDGGDTVSKTDYQEALRATQISEAIVYSIIVVPIEASAGRDTGGEHALIQLSEDTGGKYFYATTLPQLDQAFRAISDELRTQYLLAYYPARRLADSDYRRIEVKLTGVPASSDYNARHRTGYYTSKLR